MPRLTSSSQRPGSSQSRGRREQREEGEEAGADDPGGDEIEHGFTDHLVGEAGMVAIGAPQHFGADEGRGGDGSAHPGGEIGQRSGAGARPDRLGQCDAEGEEAGERQRRRAEAAEGGRLGEAALDLDDVGKGLVQLGHLRLGVRFVMQTILRYRLGRSWGGSRGTYSSGS